jgi:AraC-like DNA-binding protein
VSEHGTVLATLPRALLAYLRALGNDDDAIARAAEITLESDADARVPRERVDALWEIAVRVAGPAVGVRFALEMPPGNAGVLEVVTQSAPSVEVSLGHVCRYWHLLNDGVDLALERVRSEVALTLRTRSTRPLAPAWIDLTVVALVVIGARSIVRPLPPKRVALPYPESRAVPELAAIASAPLSYDADALAIVFPAEILEQSLLAANAPLHDVARAHADAELARLRDDGDLPSRVRTAAEARLESGDATLDRLAGALGLSARTLQRRLREHGTSLRAVLDEARRAIAMRELARGARNVTDVAFLLGFSETSAFDRAFRRWTGTTPAAYRKKHATL